MSAEINTQNQFQLAAIESGMPDVSMDIALGDHVRRGQVIDFDYDSYRTVAHDMGLGDDAIDRLQIHLENRSPGRTLGRTSYDDQTPQITVGLKRGISRRTKRSLNNTLAHETQHYADMLSGWRCHERCLVLTSAPKS